MRPPVPPQHIFLWFIIKKQHKKGKIKQNATKHKNTKLGENIVQLNEN